MIEHSTGHGHRARRVNAGHAIARLLAAAIAMFVGADAIHSSKAQSTPASDQSKLPDLQYVTAKNLDAAYFPVTRFFGLPGIYTTYGRLKVDAEMCGFAIPDSVKDFVNNDMRTFSAGQQGFIIGKIQSTHDFEKERFADLLKTSNIVAVCANTREVFDYRLTEFPESETDNVFKMLGEWQAVSEVCQVGDAGLPPIFEKAKRLGVSLEDIDKNKTRFDYWRKNALERMGLSDAGRCTTNSAYTAGPICAAVALTYQVLEDDYWKNVFSSGK
jgi:hypothetical protein